MRARFEDYETAVRMLMLSRDREAKYLLERYLKNETRQNYRTIARDLLNGINDRIDNHTTVVQASYPALLPKINKIAIDDSGQWLALGNVEPTENSGIHVSIWTVDLANGKATKRMIIDEDLIMDMSFVADSTNLRILNQKQRYQLDVTEPNGDIYIFDNPTDIYPVHLNKGGSEIMYLSEDTYLSVSTWNDAFHRRTVSSLPMEIWRVGVSHDLDRMMVVTSKENYLVNIPAETSEIIPGNFRVSSTIAAHPDMDVFAFGIQSGVLFVNGEGNYTVAGSVGSVPVAILAFSPKGHFLAVCTDMNVEILDADRMISRIPNP